MFTGIIERIGTIVRIQHRKNEMVFAFRFPAWPTKLTIGESVAVNGICLTVVKTSRGTFAAELIPETLASTTAGSWRINDRVNLERSLQIGGRIGGHFVFGHVDGIGTIQAFIRRGKNRSLIIKAPRGIIKYLNFKGSIAVDGISLTLQRIRKGSFEVGIIPHTLKATTLGDKKQGSKVNLEADMMAKQVFELMNRRKLRQHTDK